MTMGISGDMGAVDEAMCHNSHFRYIDARTIARGLDSFATGDTTGMSSRSTIIHPRGGRSSGVHDAT